MFRTAGRGGFADPWRPASKHGFVELVPPEGAPFWPIQPVGVTPETGVRAAYGARAVAYVPSPARLWLPSTA